MTDIKQLIATKKSQFAQFRILTIEDHYLSAEMCSTETTLKELVHLAKNPITQDLVPDQIVYLQIAPPQDLNLTTVTQIATTENEITACMLEEQLRIERINLDIVLAVLKTGSIADYRIFGGMLTAAHRPEHLDTFIQIRMLHLKNLNDAICGVEQFGEHPQFPVSDNISKPCFKAKCKEYLKTLQHEQKQNDFDLSPFMAAKEYAQKHSAE